MKLISENPYASATGLATFIIVIVVYVLSQFGINLPAEVIVAVTGVLTFLLGRWTRISKQDAEILDHKDQLT